MKVLVTGANGFVGSMLCKVLRERGDEIRPIVRRSNTSVVDAVVIGDIGANTDWAKHLDGVDVVVHLAARTHVVRETAADPLREYRDINVLGTERLARSAVQAGVRRFVYVSSVKVNGEVTTSRPFRESDKPTPEDYYGQTKWEAEQVLSELAANTDMETVVIRPPLVYGPGVKANLLALLKAVHRGVPLPFGLVDNRRSLVALDNLVDALVAAIDHPRAAGEVFLVSDGVDLSTRELVTKLAEAMGKKPRLLPVPSGFVGFGLRVLGKGDIYEKLFGSLQVDSAKIRERLSWKPVVSVDEALRATVEAYLKNPD